MNTRLAALRGWRLVYLPILLRSVSSQRVITAIHLIQATTLNLGALSILIVDDSAAMRAIITTLLRSVGARSLQECANGKDALAALSANPFHLMIVDYAMPLVDGVTFVRSVRRLQPHEISMIPIIMITAHGDMERIAAARDAGVNEFLVKPVSSRALLDRVDAVLERPRLFLRTPDYVGPDRRRRDDPRYRGPKRRREDFRDDEVYEID